MRLIDPRGCSCVMVGEMQSPWVRAELASDTDRLATLPCSPSGTGTARRRGEWQLEECSPACAVNLKEPLSQWEGKIKVSIFRGLRFRNALQTFPR